MALTAAGLSSHFPPERKHLRFECYAPRHRERTNVIFRGAQDKRPAPHRGTGLSLMCHSSNATAAPAYSILVTTPVPGSRNTLCVPSMVKSNMFNNEPATPSRDPLPILGSPQLSSTKRITEDWSDTEWST